MMFKFFIKISKAIRLWIVSHGLFDIYRSESVPSRGSNLPRPGVITSKGYNGRNNISKPKALLNSPLQEDNSGAVPTRRFVNFLVNCG